MTIYKHYPKQPYRMTIGAKIMFLVLNFNGKFEMCYKDERFDVTTKDPYDPDRQLRLIDFMKFPYEMSNELIVIVDGAAEEEKKFIREIEEILNELL